MEVRHEVGLLFAATNRYLQFHQGTAFTILTVKFDMGGVSASGGRQQARFRQINPVILDAALKAANEFDWVSPFFNLRNSGF